MTSIEKLQKLKTDLIELAVRGRLVEHRQEEGSAQELYEKIQQDKNKLIAEGKLKKEKPLPEISEGDIPFEIPKSWKFLKIGDICEINKRNKLNDNLEVSFIPMEHVTGGICNKFKSETKHWRFVKKNYTHFRDGQIIIAKITPCFQNRKSVILKGLKNGFAAGSSEFHTLLPINNNIVDKYILYFIKSEYFINNGCYAFNGTAGQQRVSAEFINNFIIPIPPYDEQKRIVESLEAKFKVIDKAIALLERKADLDKKIKEKILQLAIQGKLVEQKPKEGTAQELYEKIQRERQILISEGKLKKEKLLPEISEDEIHFEIPKSWKWLRIRDLVVQAKQSKPISNFKYIDVSAIDNDKKIVGTLLEYSAKDAPSRARKMVEPGMILFSTVRPYLVNTIIYNDNVNKTPVYASTAFATFSCSRIIYNRFLWYILQSTYFIEYTISCQKGISYPAINESSFYSCFVPVPPLEEQRRIVARIEQLFNIIDSQIVKQDI
ncbi:EcoKI restriction-modification system protein HsdS [Anaerobiospirillum thomasii]|uniref:restriction endonuclease subunit S n=1 Tax=Anaerobiospirillum thomasii TaxID=179995 RepID=UPI000D9B774D|nr:restriction endonuclease subunit S [Anaerobiospirillum thomasii]SPT68498.1 EcoKI restriction-modification system protein HsdS [Anaerobiospirillum thomasii]